MKKLTITLIIIALLILTGCARSNYYNTSKLQILDVQIDYELQAIEDNEGYIYVLCTFGSDTLEREYLSLSDFNTLIHGDTAFIFR